MFFITITIVFVFVKLKTEALECATPNQSKTRIFDTLLDYRQNDVSFYPSRKWQGSNVEFRSCGLYKLTRGIFITYTSESIVKLKLSEKNVEEIQDGAFLTLYCLRELLLDHNNITKLSKNIFLDLDKLHYLDLSWNKLEIMDNFVFSSLAKLKNLSLAGNQIKVVKNFAFSGLTSLEYLNLANNSIIHVTSDVFAQLGNLATLSVSWNKFVTFEIESLRSLQKLHNLEVAGDGLTNFSLTGGQNFPLLRSLNLSFNSLMSLNVTNLRQHLPQLELIVLNDNLWSCEVLESLIQEFQLWKVNVSEVQCVSKVVTTPPTPAPSSSSTGRTNQDEFHKYVDLKIQRTSKELQASIDSLRNFLILIFGLVCVLIVIEVIVRTNVCRFLIDKIRLEPVEDDESRNENFRLIGSHSHSHDL